MSDKLLFDHDGAAELLSTTPRRVHELRRAGKIAAVHDGQAPEPESSLPGRGFA